MKYLPSKAENALLQFKCNTHFNMLYAKVDLAYYLYYNNGFLKSIVVVLITRKVNFLVSCIVSIKSLVYTFWLKHDS